MLYTLYFVDDQIVNVEGKDGLSYVVRELQAAREQRSLKINKKKCEHVTFGNNKRAVLPLRDDKWSR
jgi:hypothetical protein